MGPSGKLFCVVLFALLLTTVAAAMDGDGRTPLAMASGDFDSDAEMDVLCAWSIGEGGLLTVHRGVRDDSGVLRFPSEGGAFPLPEPADLLIAGDFDNDGRLDAACGTRGGGLILLSGDGCGGFSPPEPVALPAPLTALACADVNRPDGLRDVVAGVSGNSGSSLLVFQSPFGALRGEPEVISLPAAPRSIAAARFDGDHYVDMAIAAGSELLVVAGRDRRLSHEERFRIHVPSPSVHRMEHRAGALSLTAGRFLEGPDARSELAVLRDNGSVGVLSLPDFTKPPVHVATHWTEAAFGRNTPASDLIAGNIFCGSTEDLLVLDTLGHRIHMAASHGSEQIQTHDFQGAPSAALPLRLDRDGLADLVVLREGASGPETILRAPAATFTVTTTGDLDDGTCDADCSLREAINAANGSAGPDIIDFALGAGNPVITVTGELPHITETVTIDGFTGDGRVVVTGPPTLNAPGLTLGGGSGGSVIRSLVINNFGSDSSANQAAHGIRIESDGNFVENCYLGLDGTGASRVHNSGSGVYVTGGSNTVGGSTATAGTDPGNVASCSGVSMPNVYFLGDGNTAAGNIIGLQVNGTDPIGTGMIPMSAGTGVRIEADSNIVGGITANERNIISGNRDSGGVAILGGSNNLIQGNYIGTDITGMTDMSGTLDIGNRGHGVTIGLFNLATDNTVGGPSPAPGQPPGNVISGNGISQSTAQNGVLISGTGAAFQTNLNHVEGNLIGLAADGLTPVGNVKNGIELFETGDTPPNPGNTVGGATVPYRNVVSGNGNPWETDNAGIKVSISSDEGSNLIQGNFVGTDITGMIAVPNRDDGICFEANMSSEDYIGGYAATPGEPPGNVISGANRNGIHFYMATLSTWVQGNLIGVAADGVTPMGNAEHGIRLTAESSVCGNQLIGAEVGATLTPGTCIQACNVIAHNGLDGISLGPNATDMTRISYNSIFDNGSTGNDLGIDLSDNGRTANDAGDTDEGPNLLQNWPVITDAVLQAGWDLEMTYSVNSTTLGCPGCSTYPLEIEFYKADANGQGMLYLGRDVYEEAERGNLATVTLASAVGYGVVAGDLIVATATDALGQGNTSEFGDGFPVACIPVPPPPVADGQTAGNMATFQYRTGDPTKIDITYDNIACLHPKAILVYGDIGDYTNYAGCLLDDAGNTGLVTIDDPALEDIWINIVWVDCTTAGHGGYGFDGTMDVERTWNANGLCGMTAGDLSDAICD